MNRYTLTALCSALLMLASCSATGTTEAGQQLASVGNAAIWAGATMPKDTFALGCAAVLGLGFVIRGQRKRDKSGPSIALVAFALIVISFFLSACSAGGPDGYYNDTPPTAQTTHNQPVQPVTQIAPTAQPTDPPPPQPIGAVGNGVVMVGNDYAANVAASLAMFCLSPIAFFLYAFGIGGAIMRRYGLLTLRGKPNE